MKILQVIPSVAEIWGGPSKAGLEMVKALRDCGVDAEIATTNDNGPDLLEVPLNQRIEYKGVPVWFLSRFSPPLKEFVFSAALTRWLWENIQDYDLVSTHYLFSYASTCAGAIARWHGVPYTIRVVGQLAPWALAQSRLKKQVYSFAIERHNLNRAAAIHCTSAGEAQDVRKFGIQTPTFTLPLGVNQPTILPDAKQKLRQIYGIASETPIVLFLSRLHYKKRPDLLIESLHTLKARNHDFHLILAGSGEANYLTYLQNLVSSLGLSSQTSFAGFVTGEDKNIVLQGSDIFVLPSFAENFGVAIAEAMAVGLPVIITPDIQISPEIKAANAGLVVKDEKEILANAIAQLLASPQQRQTLGENAKNLVKQRYSWRAIATNLSDVYLSIIESH